MMRYLIVSALLLAAAVPAAAGSRSPESCRQLAYEVDELKRVADPATLAEYKEKTGVFTEECAGQYTCMPAARLADAGKMPTNQGAAGVWEFLAETCGIR